MGSMQQFQRREFLAAAAASVASPCLIPAGVLGRQGRPGANHRLTVAHVGLGGMGTNHLKNMLAFRQEGKVNVAAVCDVDEKRLAGAVATAGPGVVPYRDYRYICQREDIDAVVIATPDHWHAVQTVHACQTGKHVYVEKPTSVTIAEGQAMVDAARKHRRAVQVGAQGRSGVPAYYTCRAIRNGIIGNVKKVTCWHYATPQDDNPVPDCPPPAELDWDFWLGPLPWRPYNPRYCHATFRWLMESGGGQIRDRGAHQFSTIMWCLGADEQLSYTVEATGTPPTKGLWDCPPHMEVVYTFKNPDWTLVWGQPGEKLGKTEFGQVFWGENGQLLLEWEGARKWAEPEAIDFKPPPGGFEPYHPDFFQDFGRNHMAEWLDAIHNDRLPNTDVDLSHRVATLCNLGNLAYLLGRKLQWDGVRRHVVGDDQANRMLAKPQRHPYHL